MSHHHKQEHEENNHHEQKEDHAKKEHEKHAEKTESHASEKKIKELEDKVKEYEDLLKRKMADFDNFRKRAQQDKERISEMVLDQVVVDFLPIYDNISRTVQAAEKNNDLKAFLEGVISIENIFISILGKYSITKVDSVGQEFDPKNQQALYAVEGNYEKKTVIEELEKAFIKNDRTIRPAKVVVGTPLKKEEEKKEEVQ